MSHINKKRNLLENIKLFFSGVLMGSSDIVPGVSGGTMAFILGIYEELISSISTINKELIKKTFQLKIKEVLNIFPWKFLLVLGLGIIIAIISLSHPLEYLLENEPVAIWSFFTGLILASVPTIAKRVKTWNKNTYLIFIVGVIFAFLLVGLTPQKTPTNPLFLLFSGALASTAMILPGISGSFILVLLGKYELVLSAVNDRDIITLGIIAVGAAVGIILFSKLLDYIFRKYHDITVALLAGFVLGAVRKIWPFKTALNPVVGEEVKYINRLPNLAGNNTLFGIKEDMAGILLIIIGVIVVYFINKISQEKKNEKK